MTELKPVTREVLRLGITRFIERDNEAVEALQNSGLAYIIETRLEFVSNRLENACALLSMCVRYLTVEPASDQAAPTAQEAAPK